MRICIVAFFQLSRFRINVIVPLRDAFYAVSEKQAGIEPLRAVRRGHLMNQHVAELILESLGVLRGGEVTVFFTPPAPAAGEPLDHLFHGFFRTGDDLASSIPEDIARFIGLRNTGLPEIFRYNYIGRHLAPVGWHFGIPHLENDRPVGIHDPAGTLFVANLFHRIGAWSGEPAFDSQPFSGTEVTFIQDLFPGGF